MAFQGFTGYDQMQAENPILKILQILQSSGAGTVGMPPGQPFPGTGNPPMNPQDPGAGLRGLVPPGAFPGTDIGPAMHNPLLNTPVSQIPGLPFSLLSGGGQPQPGITPGPMTPNMKLYHDQLPQEGTAAVSDGTVENDPSMPGGVRDGGFHFTPPTVAPGITDPRSDGTAGAPPLGGTASPNVAPEKGGMDGLLQALAGLQAPPMPEPPRVATPGPPQRPLGRPDNDLLKVLLSTGFPQQQLGPIGVR